MKPILRRCFFNMPAPLFQPISPALSSLFSSIDGQTKAGAPVFAGSAGSIGKRRNQHGLEYYVRRFYGGDGKQQEIYLGKVGEADERVDELRGQIEEVKALVPELRLLARVGFQVTDAKTYAALASLHLNGLFTAGAILMGSNAFGVLLNQMGVRVAANTTKDIDLSHCEMLAFKELPENGFLDILRDSGIHYVTVPQLHDDVSTLPYLAYVLGQTHISTLLGREGCCPVRVPVAERFAVHKLVVSQMHASHHAKSENGIHQASILLAALGERFPGAIEAAINDLPASARRYLIRASVLVQPLLKAHPRAAEELSEAMASIAPNTRGSD